MYAFLFNCAVALMLIGMTSCGGENADTPTTDLTSPAVDSVSPDQPGTQPTEPILEDTPFESALEYEWLVDLGDFEGRLPESSVRLRVSFSGMVDTLELFDYLGFFEERNLGSDPLDGQPDQTATIAADFLIEENNRSRYTIHWFEEDNGLVQATQPVGEFRLSDDGEDISWEFELPEVDGYKDYGEGFTWEEAEL